MSNGWPNMQRLADACRRRQTVPPDVSDWFCKAYGAAVAGQGIAAFGLTASRDDRARRDKHLARAVDKMPATWSNSQRANVIDRAAVDLAPLVNESEDIAPHLSKPWSLDLLRALQAAPIPGPDELRKIVGGFSRNHQKRHLT